MVGLFKTKQKKTTSLRINEPLLKLWEKKTTHTSDMGMKNYSKIVLELEVLPFHSYGKRTVTNALG